METRKKNTIEIFVDEFQLDKIKRAEIYGDIKPPSVVSELEKGKYKVEILRNRTTDIIRWLPEKNNEVTYKIKEQMEYA